MTRPEDIPEDVWDDAGDLIDDWAIEFSLAVVISGNIGHVLHQRIARAILAYGQRRADEAAARIAELEAEVERLRAGPKVKPLEWHNAPGAMADMQCEGVAAIGNNYVLTKLWHGQRGAEWCCLGDMYPTLDAAKAAAQADYEARVLSALVQP